MRDNEL